eukprot:303845_1
MRIPIICIHVVNAKKQISKVILVINGSSYHMKCIAGEKCSIRPQQITTIFVFACSGQVIHLQLLHVSCDRIIVVDVNSTGATYDIKWSYKNVFYSENMKKHDKMKILLSLPPTAYYVGTYANPVANTKCCHAMSLLGVHKNGTCSLGNSWFFKKQFIELCCSYIYSVFEINITSITKCKNIHEIMAINYNFSYLQILGLFEKTKTLRKFWTIFKSFKYIRHIAEK